MKELDSLIVILTANRDKAKEELETWESMLRYAKAVKTRLGNIDKAVSGKFEENDEW